MDTIAHNSTIAQSFTIAQHLWNAHSLAIAQSFTHMQTNLTHVFDFQVTEVCVVYEVCGICPMWYMIYVVYDICGMRNMWYMSCPVLYNAYPPWCKGMLKWKFIYMGRPCNSQTKRNSTLSRSKLRLSEAIEANFQWYVKPSQVPRLTWKWVGETDYVKPCFNLIFLFPIEMVFKKVTD